MKRLVLASLAGSLLFAIPHSPNGSELRGAPGYRLYEATAATVNGEVLFLSDVLREACFRACGAYAEDPAAVLSLPETRDLLIADMLVMQEQEKLGLGTVDNAALEGAAAGASDAMQTCFSPCAKDITAVQIRDYVARRLIVREFLRKRVAVFVDVNEEEVQRAVQRRASRTGIPPEQISEQAVRRELFEEKAAREIRNWFDRATSKSKIMRSPMEGQWTVNGTP